MSAVIKVSAPGSVMLMGEHAVVKGHWAIACALDKSIEVRLTPRNDRIITIDSKLAQYSACLDDLTWLAELSFVIKAIELHLLELTHGFDLKVDAQFSHTLGLGSSAAVTVAVIQALCQYTKTALSKPLHLKKALAVVHAIQGRGSGTDLAASIYGGVIAYRVSPSEVIPLDGLPKLGLYYVGYKTKTADVLRHVAELEKHCSELYVSIYCIMNEITVAAIAAVKKQDWVHLGILMNMYQGQMDSLGVNDATLSDIVYKLRDPEITQGKVFGVKISGSGLGDCVISLGEQLSLENYQSIDINTSANGVLTHD